ALMTNLTTEPTVQDTDLDELGPVDYIVVEFPAAASNFTGEMAEALLALVDSGTVRVIDILILTKNEDGTVDAKEFSDVENLGPLQKVEGQLAELLAADDVVHLAAAMNPGSTAGVLIWENLWAAPFASAARRSGGQLIANGRIPSRPSSPRSRPTKHSQRKETDHAPQASTRRTSRCHRPSGGEDRGRGQGRHTWSFPGCQNSGSDRGRHAWAWSPATNLARCRRPRLRRPPSAARRPR